MVGAQEAELGGCRKQEERNRVNAPGTNPFTPGTRETLVLDSSFCIPAPTPSQHGAADSKVILRTPLGEHPRVPHPSPRGPCISLSLSPDRPGSRTAASPRHDCGGIKLELSKKRGPEQLLSAGQLTRQRPESQVKWAGSRAGPLAHAPHNGRGQSSPFQ